MEFDWCAACRRGFLLNRIHTLLFSMFEKFGFRFDFLPLSFIFFLVKKGPASFLVSGFPPALFLPVLLWPLPGLSPGAHSACWKVTESFRMKSPELIH